MKHSSIRTFFSIVAMHDLELELLDVKTAFLYGEFEEEIYMDQPEGFIVPGKNNYVCKLKKSLYSLKQSPRQWYKRFDSFMLLHGSCWLVPMVFTLRIRGVFHVKSSCLSTV